MPPAVTKPQPQPYLTFLGAFRGFIGGVDLPHLAVKEDLIIKQYYLQHIR